MNDPVSSDDLKKLKKHWYTILKKEGFHDIEDTDHPDQPLKVWHSFKWKNLSPDKKLEIEIYFEKARNLLNTYNFDTDIHKRIWELHCEGLSKRKIEQAISSSSKPYKRESIGLIIKIIASTIL